MLPPEGVDEVLHVRFEELVDDAQGIFVRGGIEIQGAAEEVAGGVGEEELISGSGVPADVEIDAADTVGGLDDGLVDGTGFGGMFESHFEGIIAKPVETVAGSATAGLGTYCLIADIDTGGEAGEVHVYPIGILWQGIEIAAVPYNIGVDGIFEGIREAALIEGLVLMWWEVYFEIAASFGRVYAIARKQKGQQQKGESGIKRLWIRHWLF